MSGAKKTERCNDKTRPITASRLQFFDVTTEGRSDNLKRQGRVRLSYDNSKKLIRAFRCSYGNLYEFIDDMVNEGPWFEKDRVTGRANYQDEFRRTDSATDYTSRQVLFDHLSKGHTTKKGWKSYSKAKAKVLASPEHLQMLGGLGGDMRRKRQPDLGGYLVNIDSLMCGLDPIESIKRNAKAKSVRVFIDYSQSCGVPAERIWETTTNAIAICEAIERKGYATEISFGHTGAYMDSRHSIDNLKFRGRKNAKALIGVQKFIAKRAGVPFNESALLNYAVAGVFRDLIFEHMEQCLGMTCGLGQPLHVVTTPSEDEQLYKELCECDVYIGKESAYDDIATNIVGHIKS